MVYYVGAEKPTLEDALEHYGVMGMKWGTHKERTPEQQIQRINKKIQKYDMDNYLSGIGIRGHSAKKINKRALKKNPEFSYKKLSPEAKAKYDSKVNRKARNSVMLRGATEVAIILGSTYGLTKAIKASPRARNGALVSAAILAGQNSIGRVGEVRAVNKSIKIDKLKSERDSLGYNPDKHWKG